jgi:hypothetical protein
MKAWSTPPVKAGAIDDLPHESLLLAKIVQEHMHLKHVHNALEFPDLRGGTPYDTTFNGDPVSPSTHLALHAAVKGQIEADPLVRAAFDKMVTTGKIPGSSGLFISTNFKNPLAIPPSAKSLRRASPPIIPLWNGLQTSACLAACYPSSKAVQLL